MTNPQAKKLREQKKPTAQDFADNLASNYKCPATFLAGWNAAEAHYLPMLKMAIEALEDIANGNIVTSKSIPLWSRQDMIILAKEALEKLRREGGGV